MIAIQRLKRWLSPSLHPQWQGSAAALFAIELANSLLDAGRKMRPAVLLALMPLAAIPLVDLVGQALARILPASSIMPMGYA